MTTEFQRLDEFKLPPGFAIHLVVSEPDIGQPMNLNFDARGRLWITSSVEYPYPANRDLDPRRGRFKDIGDHPPHAVRLLAGEAAPTAAPRSRRTGRLLRRHS